MSETISVRVARLRGWTFSVSTAASAALATVQSALVGLNFPAAP